MLFTLPEAKNAPAPKVIKPGTRLVYYGQSASISATRTQVVPIFDEKKKHWVLINSGKKIQEVEIPNVGGMGLSVVQVGHVDDKRVTLSARHYLLNPLDKSIIYTNGNGIVTNAGVASDYWINPDVLAKVKEMNRDGVVIMRMKYPLNGKIFNAIRFQTTTKTGYQAYVYDLETGLMIFHGSASKGEGVKTFNLDKTKVVEGGGATTLINGWILEVKDVELPWKDAPSPDWAKQFKQLRYDGAQSSVMPGLPVFSRPAALVIKPKAVGDDWVRFTSDLTVTNQAQFGVAVPPEMYHSEYAGGNAALFGLWIPPKAIGNLKQGQVLETNDITKTKTLVSEVGQGYVTITEFGQLHRVDHAYDTSTGVLRGLQVSQQMGPGTQMLRVSLSGQQ